ncbi:isoleucine--tRNA ligase [Altererythrobacter sp. H2]|uniref:isoleucine--tRNA ligase n=1 Tax=Altererythrobacter sp. H2 TaxID=3108391 RepID=UPI002B4BA8CC|nr:isoleucine--tRNA ligase [Altererythrobacter sp. H2]WRK95970.1 isoleucine--tRNA ligase [Altererythrobacter sp. H2]
MTEQTKRDYRDTVFLPKTEFPMKAGLPQKEPGMAARWEAEGLYRQLRESRAGRESFILHDGPPYANGDMHIGHALNHVLKDMVCRTQNLLGKDAPYVPGWDCHGLPIEWKVEEAYRKAKKAKPVLSGAGRDEAEVKAFRDECRAYAQGWVDTQREQLKRLGIMGDWDNPYLTMQKDSEAIIVAELLKLAEAGTLYRGAKPVMWSPVEETALAEAEVEYEDITSTQIDVAFEIVESPIPELVGAHAVIWTTTPWTIPVNQALAYGPEVEYRLIQWQGRNLLVADKLVADVWQRLRGWRTFSTVSDENGPILEVIEYNDSPPLAMGPKIKGADLAGTLARHPMHHLGGFYATPRPLLPGDFVTTDSGTGLVHMAPDHGEDDFELCKAHGIEPVFAVRNDGRYRDDWAWLGGADERRMSVINPKFNAPDGPICSDLREAGALLAASADYQHSYPHSWRSKAKVIFRCTPQWFVPMDRPLTHLPAKTPAEKAWEGEGGRVDPADETPCASPTLREAALAEIERVRFFPEKGRNRIGSMVAGRPDWVLSRQRAWGVPITLFVRPDGTYLNDPAVNARIVAAVRDEGMDAWNSANKGPFLGPDHNPDQFEMVTDILDVWFDSGTTHAFVLESGRWPALRWPADLYLEGSDQHRGWFQSSLLESCATRGRAPYDQVLTHGFTMASDGRKMSKSLGNTIDPIKVMENYGADIIRLWALSVDFTEDHRIGDEILKGVGDQYRKLRNTFRYLLGALDGFSEAERVAVEAMPELEWYVLHMLKIVDGHLRVAATEYDFNTYVRTLSDFCNEDLSAFFFDIRKDCLYCDAADDPKRMAYRTVLDTLFHALVRYAAPVLVFTAEEVWGTRYPDGGSVHLLEWPDLPEVGTNSKLMKAWQALRNLRQQVTEAIEPYRRDKTIRSGLEALVTVPGDAVPGGINDAALAELFITATVARGQGSVVIVTPTTDPKCGRCWRHLPEVAEDGALCHRCDTVVSGTGETA